MKYQLIQELIPLLEVFESSQTKHYPKDLTGFIHWLIEVIKKETVAEEEPYWEGKEKGRTPESVINTLIVHMNRYAKTYSKSAIYDSDFSTQEEFIYLINLNSFGKMSKMDLIKKNIHDKPVGMQIIGRLLHQGWITQQDSKTDKRSKILTITTKGRTVLSQQMKKIRRATQIVTGDLEYSEKMELIRLLSKLEHFHQAIYSKNVRTEELLEVAAKNLLPEKN